MITLPLKAGIPDGPKSHPYKLPEARPGPKLLVCCAVDERTADKIDNPRIAEIGSTHFGSPVTGIAALGSGILFFILAASN
mmetsp:Transcript_23321/g.36486  ORF Transcript_23321/g.36486 Transcript_23321/m.36486 type:complete len:81 (+) Transcript_23321:106-348(+)